MEFRFRTGTSRRVLSVLNAAALAGALLVSSVVQAVPVATADSVGEIVVQPVDGKTIADVNARFKTTTQLTMTGTTQAMVRSNAVQATLNEMNADAKSAQPVVKWAEQNVRASDPRAQDDSGADPYCPPPPADVPTQATSQDDSGADGRTCTRVIPITGLLAFNNGLLRLNSQYAVDKLKVGEAQRKEQGDGQIVAVLDTQVRFHLLLETRMVGGLDLLGASLITLGATRGHAQGHGTFVAGVVAQTAPLARIMPVRVLNDDGVGSTVQVAEGIRWAVAHGADVINMSLHTPTDTMVMRTAVADAIKAGVVVVAAYGNEGRNMPAAFPADYPGVISVMATDQNDKRASFSNYGRAGLVAAPGVNIISTYPQGLFAVGSGTSYAAPWVAGEAALLKDANQNLTAADVRAMIRRNSDDVSAANGGAQTARANVLRAVTEAKR